MGTWRTGIGMSHLSRAPDRADAFRSLYEFSYADLLKFVQRRTQAANAEDVVAEAFLIVWRRFSEAPADENDARAWVFGIATYEQRTAANKPTARKTNRRRRTVILGGLAAAATAGLLIMAAREEVLKQSLTPPLPAKG